MARVGRTAMALPVAGSVVAALALAGFAVFTVAESGCAAPGHYVQDGNQVELIGGCFSTADLAELAQYGGHPATHDTGRQQSP